MIKQTVIIHLGAFLRGSSKALATRQTSTQQMSSIEILELVRVPSALPLSKITIRLESQAIISWLLSKWRKLDRILTTWLKSCISRDNYQMLSMITPSWRSKRWRQALGGARVECLVGIGMKMWKRTLWSPSIAISIPRRPGSSSSSARTLSSSISSRTKKPSANVKSVTRPK